MTVVLKFVSTHATGWQLNRQGEMVLLGEAVGVQPSG
jgi:hypothetical protein